MQKQSEVIRSQQQTGLTILSKDVILKEQDPKEVIKHIAVLLNRLGKLYLIPGFTEENAVILAEWVYDNYQYEELKIVTRCLNNPPTTHDEQGRVENNWRLTPDRIQKWMQIELEKLALDRENENKKLKESFKEPLPGIDYESYKQRINQGLALQDEKKKTGFEDPEYLKFKAERMKAMASKPKEV